MQLPYFILYIIHFIVYIVYCVTYVCAYFSEKCFCEIFICITYVLNAVSHQRRDLPLVEMLLFCQSKSSFCNCLSMTSHLILGFELKFLIDL